MTGLTCRGFGLLFILTTYLTLTLAATCNPSNPAPTLPPIFLTNSLRLPSGAFLNLTMNHTTPPPTTPPNQPLTFTRTGSVLNNGSPLYTYNITLLPSGDLYTHITWLPPMAGASSATLVTKPDNTTTGTIDGKPLTPFKITPGFDATTVLFADGSHIPALRPPPGFDKTQVQALSDHLVTTNIAPLIPCAPQAPVNVTTVSVLKPGSFNVALSPHIITERGLDRAQDPGHISDTYGAAPCVACKTAAYAAEAVALAGCTVACIFSFGSACAVCYGAAGLGIVTALEACEHSGFCCPSSCGRGGVISPGTCCFGDESCLDHAGHCCSADQTPCVGKTCCNPDQSCITSGPSKGTCCPDTATQCNGQCCPGDTDKCVGGTCCAPENVCNGVCCPQQQDGLFPPRYCADWGSSLCCFQGQVNVGGICCPQGQSNCGGQCCPGRCVGGNQCVQTSDDCLKHGGNGDTCTNEGGWCPLGFAICHQGCCMPQPK